ncbi:hypothetical protein CONCODRAFT_168593 [Conidiobolus coronatus NRRL 28638]|uniref:SHSP domain-containing protein n=1 Tax=Conidiobolus coronatus (strain ATCC 28846 / CBS 209.66 / NRRL 28638) TaxID=796925 RepID=A0A137PC45_CONC2|nr:hypothetical protein CONCODRAFT_168593 [Conidiobolus coronatus NRRL 28638]|eukprot:KXN72569.1 hypothetical protein CONCODRAFT_168593 [Conidiobolus coronatus NRRL 28638]
MNDTYQKRFQIWAGSFIQSVSNTEPKSNHSLFNSSCKYPACDIYESDSHFIALLDAPGYNENNIRVELNEKIGEIELVGLTDGNSKSCHISELVLRKLNDTSVSGKKESVFNSEHDQSKWTKHFSERELNPNDGWYRKLSFPPKSLADISNTKVYSQLGIIIVTIPKLSNLSSTSDTNEKRGLDAPSFDDENTLRCSPEYNHLVNIDHEDENVNMSTDPAVTESLLTD